MFLKYSKSNKIFRLLVGIALLIPLIWDLLASENPSRFFHWLVFTFYFFVGIFYIFTAVKGFGKFTDQYLRINERFWNKIYWKDVHTVHYKFGVYYIETKSKKIEIIVSKINQTSVEALEQQFDSLDLHLHNRRALT